MLGIASGREIAGTVIDPRHAEAFESMGVVIEGGLDRARLREVLGELPAGVVRAKGILWIADDPERRAAYQRVGQRWGWVPLGPWGRQRPASTVLLIARRGTLERQRLADALDACGRP